MKHEKWAHLGLGVLALGLSVGADAMGITLSTDSVWIIRGFAGMALGLGTIKHLAEGKKKDA